MTIQPDFSRDVYAVTKRLIHLRDMLRTGPHDLASIITGMPDDYTNDEHSKRQIRRDLHNLEALGYTITSQNHPRRWTIIAGPWLLSNEDVQALIYIREAFTDGHPIAPMVKNLLATLTKQLSQEQQRVWQRRPALRVPLKPVRDYSNCESLIEFLESAITNRQQIAFGYHPRGSESPVFHNRIDPYEIEYVDRQFYLRAFSYRYGAVLTFRLDRILQNKQSPELLRDRQQPRRERKSIQFTYRLPASFADGGISERFTIKAVRHEGEYVIVEASDPSEFHIIRTLLSYGEHALLLDGPPTLLDKMHEVVRRMQEQYAENYFD